MNEQTENPHEKANKRRLKSIADAINKGTECFYRESTGNEHYCRASNLAEKAKCPYLSEEKVFASIDKVSKDREDFILKKTDVKPEKRKNVPVGMEERNRCDYKPLE